MLQVKLCNYIYCYCNSFTEFWVGVHPQVLTPHCRRVITSHHVGFNFAFLCIWGSIVHSCSAAMDSTDDHCADCPKKRLRYSTPSSSTASPGTSTLTEFPIFASTIKNVGEYNSKYISKELYLKWKWWRINLLLESGYHNLYNLLQLLNEKSKATYNKQQKKYKETREED